MTKLNENELQSIGIYQWRDIEEKYKGADLFLGNGFSIKISNKLNYHSLFETFINKISEHNKTIFENFDTTNFEFILEKINNAIAVNKIFKIQHDQLTQSTDILRNGLIESISQNHPRYHDLENDIFKKLSIALDSFEDIFTTNYDTFLYRIIMQTLDRYSEGEKIKRYQDYFWLASNDFLKFMDTQNDPSYKSIYFLHGALFIFQNNAGHFKIRRGPKETELLDLIYSKITTQQFPLFVAEGTTQDKENKINRSGYLSFCRNKFRNRNKNLVIYGSSLSPQDAHFITDLNFNGRNLAVSIRCQNKSETELHAIKLDIVSKFNRLRKEEVVLFDADSLFG